MTCAAVLLMGCATGPSTEADHEGDDPLSLMAQAYRYEQGVGVPRDVPKAFRIYREAAEGGLPDAQYQVGLMYELGLGVAADIHEAQYWYQRAIDQGFCPGELKAPADLVRP